MKRDVTWWAIWLGAFICLLGSTKPAFSKEIPLEEVNISLYNKPVTGFRLVLDRSERFVANQIIEHVADADATSPFQYERSIIYENIRYAPIVGDRDISLYFLLKSIQGQFTELTVVVMYDYRRAISSRDFPELAQKLKVDLAKLVRHLNGDVLQSEDILYDDATLAKLDASQGASQKPSGPDPQNMTDHFNREEVEHDDILLRNDPFKKGQPIPAQGSNDSTLQRLVARVQALETKEQQWLTTERELRNEQATLQRKQEVLLSKVKDNKALHDSIELLNERVEALINQTYVADDVSVSSETASEIDALEKENARYKRQISNLNHENDSLRKVATNFGAQLDRLSAGGRSTSEQLSNLTAENKHLKHQLEEYQNRIALTGSNDQSAVAADSLLDLLAQAQVQSETQRRENETQNRTIGRLKQENDELSGKKMQLEERMASLEAENRSLREGNSATMTQIPNENLIDSLNGEVRSARRSASISKAELSQVRVDMAAIQTEKDTQERQLIAAQSQQKSLQSRIDALNANGGNEGGSNARTVPGNSEMSDSLLLLKQQLKRAETLASQASASKEALARTESQLQARDRELSATQIKLQEKIAELAEAQKAKATLQKSLTDANTRLADSQNSKGSAQQELDRLQQENRSLTTSVTSKDQQIGKKMAENKTLLDSIAVVRTERGSLRRDIEARDRILRLQVQERDSLKRQLILASNRENDLRRSIAALAHSVDSLASVRVPEGDQARYLKEQRAKLDHLQKDLDARDITTTNKEKLLAQRESVLLRKEGESASQTDRFKNLEEREKRLQMLEQQLNAREGVAAIDASPIVVREGRIVEFGSQMPVFIVESGLTFKAIQRQIAGYMISRDELFDNQFPELLYRMAHLGELDSEPVELKVRIDTKANGTILQISVRLSNGEYLGGEKYRERNDAAKQLISKMLRYKI